MPPRHLIRHSRSGTSDSLPKARRKRLRKQSQNDRILPKPRKNHDPAWTESTLPSRIFPITPTGRGTPPKSDRSLDKTFALKKKTSFRDWATLIAFGSVGMVAYHLIVGIVALLIGFLVATFSEIPWHVAALISYLGLRLVVEGIDAFAGPRSTRCTACNRKIRTSKPIKCGECGGAARLVGGQHEAKKP